MSAAEALRAAQAAGIAIALDGDALLLEALAEPPQSVLDALVLHKREILNLLQPDRRGWGPQQWRAYFEKHYGIAVRIAERPNSSVRASALECCVVEWLNRHPAPSAPERCAWCSRAESPGAVILPFGTEPRTHAWLHAECWPNWHEARRTEAILALGLMGIAAPFK